MCFSLWKIYFAARFTLLPSTAKETYSLLPLKASLLCEIPLGYRATVYNLQDIEYTSRDVVAVREDSHLKGTVRTAGEDAVSWAGLHLHHSGADVAEDGLLGVLRAEGVH